MQHEIAFYDYELDKKETINRVFSSVSHNKINGISILPQYVNILNKYIPVGIYTSSVVDYPFGLNSIKVRNHNVMTVAKYGLNFIDLVVNTHFLANQEWDNLEKDIKSNAKICEDNGCKLRIIYEYRKFPTHIIDLAPILEECGIEYFLPSTGLFVDNCYDNILAANAFKESNKFTKIILTGNVWTDKQYLSCKKFKPYGLRFHHLNNVNLIGGV